MATITQPATASAAAPATTPMGVASPEAQEATDGFHLVIDALKLNGIDTIFGLPGIPVTDLCRMAQAEGMRVISFRHEQHAGNAVSAIPNTSAVPHDYDVEFAVGVEIAHGHRGPDARSDGDVAGGPEGAVAIAQ